MRIVLVGAGGHGKVCAEIAQLCGYREIFFLDDNQKRNSRNGYPVAGAGDDFERFVDDATDFFVSIGNAKIRKKIQDKIKRAGGRVANLVHPKSIISKDVEVGMGNVVMPGVVINPGVVLGDGVIVNTGSSIDHDCIIGDYSHVAVGAHLCGKVKIGNLSWIGAGAVVNHNLNICDECTVASGAVVIRDIIEPGTYIGVPVRKRK